MLGPAAGLSPRAGDTKAAEVPGAEPRDRGGADGQEDASHDDRRQDARDLDLLDPAARHAALLAPPVTVTPAAPPATSTEAAARPRTLEELLPALVKRIAWAGDKDRGTVSFELGAGAFAGTSVTVHADGGRVRVELSGVEGPDLDRLRARLGARLRQSGIDLESVT
ncbi:MAG: hypothetical protein JWP97_1656 [Labilithrix sp.]|nr:hypothetical protein [Labilithrix sp.]